MSTCIHEHDLHRRSQSTQGMMQSCESFVWGNTFKSLNENEKNEKTKHWKLKRPPSGRCLIKDKYSSWWSFKENKLFSFWMWNGYRPSHYDNLVVYIHSVCIVTTLGIWWCNDGIIGQFKVIKLSLILSGWRLLQQWRAAHCHCAGAWGGYVIARGGGSGSPYTRYTTGVP